MFLQIGFPTRMTNIISLTFMSCWSSKQLMLIKRKMVGSGHHCVCAFLFRGLSSLLAGTSSTVAWDDCCSAEATGSPDEAEATGSPDEAPLPLPFSLANSFAARYQPKRFFLGLATGSSFGTCESPSSSSEDEKYPGSIFMSWRMGSPASQSSALCLEDKSILLGAIVQQDDRRQALNQSCTDTRFEIKLMWTCCPDSPCTHQAH